MGPLRIIAVSVAAWPGALQFHASLDPDIIVLRYVTLCNGRNRAAGLARTGQSHVGRAARQPGSSSAFPVRPDCSVAVAAQGGAGAEAAHERSATVSPATSHPAVFSRRLCQVARSGSWRSNGLLKWINYYTEISPVQPNIKPTVPVVSNSYYSPARLDRTRPDRRISLPSSVRVPRSKLRNRIAQLLSSRCASAIVSFRNASDR